MNLANFRQGIMLNELVPLQIDYRDAFWLIVDGVIETTSKHASFVRDIKGAENKYLMCKIAYLLKDGVEQKRSLDLRDIGGTFEGVGRERCVDFCNCVGLHIMRELLNFYRGRAWVNVKFSLCQLANCLLSIQRSRITDQEAIDYAKKNEEAFREYLYSVVDLPLVDSRFRYCEPIEAEFLEELCNRSDLVTLGWMDGRRNAGNGWKKVTPEMGLVRAFCHAHSAMAEKGAS